MGHVIIRQGEQSLNTMELLVAEEMQRQLCESIRAVDDGFLDGLTVYV